MPKALRVGKRVIWDRLKVEAAFADLDGGSSGPWCKYHLMGDIAVGGLEDPLFWIGLVAPPIAALLLRYTLLWIGRGFRQERSK